MSKNKLTRKEKQILGMKRIADEKYLDTFIRSLKPVSAKNDFQKKVLKSLRYNQIVIISGSAGVGKTYLSVTHSADKLFKGEIDKLIIARPAVGMGDTLGYLKGSVREKYEPYLYPLISVMKERYGVGKYETALAAGNIEMVPLEYLRGYNIDSVAILDEAQNSTPSQMYSLLTRVTDNGQLIILGDPNQTDIIGENGLSWIKKFIISNNLQDYISYLESTPDDIVRGKLCKLLVQSKENEVK